MTRMQFPVALVVLFAGGIVGGGLTEWAKGKPAIAQGCVPHVIAAREFRVVDAEGEQALAP